MTTRSLTAALVFLLAACLGAGGQEVKSSVTGRVIEEENGQPVIQAGVQLLSARDSTLVDGSVTNADGQFKIPCISGDYILKISFIGFTTVFRDVHKTLSKNDLDLGAIPLSTDAIFLESAVVAAKAPPVTVIEDTVVYNAAAFRVAEDASLGELLKKIPGLEISGSTVTLHGKQVKKLLVGGRKFFGGDVKAGLKNISADMVENIRAYEMESDMTRLTGVDDGDEEPVLDITMKKGVMNSWRNRVALGGGTSERYMARANATRMTKNNQISVIANLHNTGNEDVTKITANNVVGNGSRGETGQSEAGLTFSRKTASTELGGSFLYNGSDRDASADVRQQNILASSMSYVNSANHYLTLKNDFKGNFELEHKLPSDFTLLFNGLVTYNGSNAYTDALSSNFKKDPYSVEGVDPADWLGIDIPGDPFKSFRVNSTRNRSQTIGDKFAGNFSVQLAKRMAKKGRSLSGKVTFIYNGSDELQAHDYLTRYYKIKAKPDSARLRKQYLQTLNPSRTWITQLTYSEPLHKQIYLQAIYTFTYKNTDNDKSFYSLENSFPEWSLDEGLGRKGLVSSLPSGYESAFDPLFSSVGRYDYFSHRINLNLRYLTKKINVTGGVNLVPQNTVLSYDDGAGPQTIKTSVFNVSPMITVRFKQRKTKQFNLTYRGVGSSPTMYNLMPVTNGTNATNVYQGNPYLKPTFTQTMNLSYNSSNIKKQESLVTGVQYQMTQNAISNLTQYDEDSGVRTSSPENIDGNWRVTASMSVNKTFRDSRFSMSSSTRGEYRNTQSYLYNNKLKVAEVNTTTRAMARELADLTFRNDWLEILLSGGGEITDERSLLRPDMNQTPWALTAGSSLDITLPWKMHLTADLTTIFQRGYSYDELNKDYYILNARLTQPFFKGKLLMRLDWYDALDNGLNIVRSFTAERRSVTIYNGVNSYLMLRLVYKFKLS